MPEMMASPPAVEASLRSLLQKCRDFSVCVASQPPADGEVTFTGPGVTEGKQGSIFKSRVFNSERSTLQHFCKYLVGGEMWATITEPVPLSTTISSRNLLSKHECGCDQRSGPTTAGPARSCSQLLEH